MTIAIDTETTGLFIHKGCRPFVISAACDNNKSYIWEFKVNPYTREVIYDEGLENFKDTISKHEQLIFHNANFDIQALVAIGLNLEDLFSDHDIHDTMVMSHAYRSHGPHGLKELGISVLEFPADDEKRLGDITKKARDIAKKMNWCIANEKNPHPSLLGLQESWHKSDYWIPKQLAEELEYPANHEWRSICIEYAEKDAIRTMALFNVLPELMDEQQYNSYLKNVATVPAILRMEFEKVQTKESELIKARETYTQKFVSSTIQLQHLSKIRDFNPNSSQQIKKVLFDTYKFTTDKKTDSGEMSTDKTVISELLKSCPQVDPLPERYQFLADLKIYRKTKTTLSYLTNYSIHCDKDFKLQPFFKLTATGTGRLGCENPNTTNVGKDDMNNPFSKHDLEIGIGQEDESFKLRNIFGPKKGSIWTCIDYSQFQLLIFAIVSGSDRLVDAYLEGIDLHHAVAREIFGTDDISSVQRTAAKAINFGILFGAGPAKIEQTAGMPGLYNKFLSQLPGAKSYLIAQEKLARQLGYVTTLGGYRLYTPRERPYAASCYAIQGTEAEIVKDAMVDISNYCYHTKWFLSEYQSMNQSPRLPLHTLTKPAKPCNYRMVMMVHDELIFQSTRTSEPHLKNIMRLMENAGRKIGVPVKVDADIVVDNWADKQELKISIPFE